jgi:hypothetical protein
MAHHGRPTIYSEAHSRRAETTGQGEASQVGAVTIVTDPPGVISGDDPSSNSRQHFFHLGTVPQTQQDAECGFPRGELEFSAPPRCSSFSATGISDHQSDIVSDNSNVLETKLCTSA